MLSNIIKERPILFSGPMVRALRAGTKTQTRRAVKPQPEHGMSYVNGNFILNSQIVDGVHLRDCNAKNIYSHIRCPYGQPGDQLWVRESFYAYGFWEKRWDEKKGRMAWMFIDQTELFKYAYEYERRSGPNPKRQSGEIGWYKRPSLFMPRAASRLLLEITAVRCERVQAISEADAVAEGVESCIADLKRFGARARGMRLYRDYERKENSLTADRGTGYSGARPSFCSLWRSINGPDSWHANPWVWVVEFRVIKAGKEAASC